MADYNASSIAERIKKEARAKKKPLNIILSNVNLGINAISQLSAGQEMSYLSFARIADEIDCSIDYLLGRTESPTINGNNNINQQYIGGNATANIGTADNERSDADVHELLEMIESLSIVQKAEIILKINEMLNKK